MHLLDAYLIFCSYSKILLHPGSRIKAYVSVPCNQASTYNFALITWASEDRDPRSEPFNERLVHASKAGFTVVKITLCVAFYANLCACVSIYVSVDINVRNNFRHIQCKRTDC